MESKQAIEAIKRESNRLYDPKVVTLMDQYLATINLGPGVKEHAIMLQDLKPGMVLSRDIVTTNGLKIMPSGAILSENIIKRIFSHNSSDPILGHVFVKS